MDSVKEGIRRNLVDMVAKSGKRNVDLANACGVGRSAVTNWLNGRSSIDVERMPAICDFFGVTMDEFFGRSKAMEPSRWEDGLSAEERQLITFYRRSSDFGKDRIIAMAEAIFVSFSEE